MSNPSDVPPPQPGALPPPSNNVPPAGSAPSQPNPQIPEGYESPPQGYQPPQGYGTPPQGYDAPGQQGYGAPQPGYGQPPQQGYPAPGQTGRPAPTGRMRFEMPGDRPRNFNDVLPQGGFSGMFTVTQMPTELKVSYWIWLIGGLLGLLGGVIGLFGSFVLIAIVPPLGLLVLLLVLVALVLAAAQVVLAMKMKEGREWARFALTIVAGISLVLAIINASAADGRGGGSWPGFIVSLAAAVLMWLPNSQAWFAGLRGRAQ
ncbi:hypothetical protein [Pseudarthrobacter albicanus]|uniref:hypothetical protein n=1 Tax=Pseudarthrobacter albicanus TaxID=2823873 RepID=UPI001FE34918|nr:hypothetical protein [Pseudarthrobacter albicanus]